MLPGQWDSSGDQLALLPTGVGFLLLYSQGTRETQRIDTNMKARSLSPARALSLARRYRPSRLLARPALSVDW